MHVNDPQPLVQFPVPSATTLYILGATFAGLLVAAVAAELIRRRRIRRARTQQQWRAAHDIFRERGIAGTDAELLEKLIRRHLPREPLKTVTTREGFEFVLDREFNRRRPDDPEFERLGIQLRSLRNELGLDYVPVGHSLQSTRELHDGQWMQVALPSEQRLQWTRVMVEDVNEAYFYVVLKDSPPAAVPHFQPGQTVHCRLWREEDARYLFDTAIAAYDEPPPTWRMRHTNQLTRTQARTDFRVRHEQPVVAGVINAPLNKEDVDIKARPVVTKIPGRLTSLSAGGCAIVFKQAIARHVLLRINLDVPGLRPFDTEVEIVATAPISGGRYLVRGRFLGLSEETRDKIARYVLHKQQQRLAKQPKG